MIQDQLHQIKQMIEDQQIEMIDLKFVDLSGQFRHLTLPSHSLDESLLAKGVGFDGSSVGFKSVKSGDMCIIPDLSTCFIDPFWQRKTLSFFCNIVEADTKMPFSGDPRSIIRRTVSYLQESGIGEMVLVLPELEFNIFDTMMYHVSPLMSCYEISCRESRSAALNPDSLAQGFWMAPQGGYHAAAPADTYRDIRAEIVELLEKSDVEVRYHHHEVGATGQQEIELTLQPVLSSCDQAMLTKYYVRNVVNAHGKTATFMPKPITREAGNGMHLHLRLVGKHGEPLFFDENDAMGLSELAYCFIGGIIQHGRSITAFTNPSVNSYRRLVKGYEAPTNLFFSLGNRNAAIRIPKYAIEPDKKRFELRSPDATCNIYFAVAAMVMAGVDGVKRGIHAQKNNWGPFDDIENLSTQFRRHILALPESLEEALLALKKDHEYLTAGQVFSPTLINGWIDSKYTKDIASIKNQTTPLEFELYYNC